MLDRIRHRPTMAAALIQLLALFDLGLERRIGLRTRRLKRRLRRRAIEFLDIELVEVHALEAAHLRTREHTDPSSISETSRTLMANSFPSIMPGARARTAVPHVGQNLSRHQLITTESPAKRTRTLWVYFFLPNEYSVSALSSPCSTLNWELLAGRAQR